jgi:thiol:disulfide interchange protein
MKAMSSMMGRSHSMNVVIRCSAVVAGFVTLAAAVALPVTLPGCGRPYIENTPVPANSAIPFDPPASYPDIDWSESLEEGRARAAEEHRPLLLFVRAAWSRPSVIMDATIWKDSRVLAEAARFVAVRIDLTGNYGKPMPTWLSAFTVDSIPTTIVMGSDGEVTGRFVAGVARAADVAKAMQQAK